MSWGDEACNTVAVADIAVGAGGEDGGDSALAEEVVEVVGEHAPAAGNDDGFVQIQNGVPFVRVVEECIGEGGRLIRCLG